MSHNILLGNYIEEIRIRLRNQQRTVYSVTNTKGFVPSLDVFDKQVFSTDISNYKLVAQNDLAYNPSRINVGSVAICPDLQGGAVSPMYVIVRCKNGLLPEYLLYFLKSNVGLAEINLRTEGAVRFQLKFKDLQRIPIYLPPLTEQARLVRLLDEADALRRLRASADTRMAALIPALFHEMFGLPTQNTKGWKTCKLGDLCETRLGKMLDAKQQTGLHVRPYLRNTNVQWNHFDLTDILGMDFDERDREIFRLKTGDILVCEGGEVGRCAIWNNELPECYFQKALHRIRPNLDVILPEYIVWLMGSLAQNGGLLDSTIQSTIAHLTGIKLKALVIPLPPISLQREFVARVQEARAIQAQQAASQARLDALFQAMLARAFAGAL